MKKNRMMRLASILLVCVLLTTSVISGTFAKYTSTASGSDTARVAKWSFNVGDINIAKTETTVIAFDVFKTIMDETLDADDAEVYGDKVIAPGTRGEFTIKLANTSEVDAKYAIDFQVTNVADPTVIPLWYSLNETEWTQNITTLNIPASADTQLDYNGGAKDSDEVTVYWKWKYEGETGESQTDTTDTVLGIYAAAGSAATVTVTATVTATQVD